jgi:hypothetical protein
MSTIVAADDQASKEYCRPPNRQIVMRFYSWLFVRANPLFAVLVPRTAVRVEYESGVKSSYSIVA